MHSIARGSIRFRCLALVLGALLSQAVWAHHGWAWATDDEFELSGVIIEVRLGNPHGELTLEVGAEHWIVEVGQPWRNTRAELTEEQLRPGQAITAHGHRSAREGEKRMKAERLVIDGKNHVLYPDRES